MKKYFQQNRSITPSSAVVVHASSRKKKAKPYSPIVYLLIKNKANFQDELRQKLLASFGEKRQKADKLKRKLTKAVLQLSADGNPKSGVIKLKIRKSAFLVFHYLMKFKNKSKKFIEIYIFDLSADMNLSLVLNKLYREKQNHYHTYLRDTVHKDGLKYLKMIGKGRSDYDIENRLNLSRVELMDLKDKLCAILKLRNNNELYWVSQNAGFVR